MWMTMSYSQKKLGFFQQLDEVCHLQSWRGHMRSIWRISLFHGSRNMCTRFFPHPSGELSPCLEGKNPTQIGHHMWKILAHTFKQHMQLPPKTSNANLTQKSYENAKRMDFQYVILAHMVGGTLKFPPRTYWGHVKPKK